jgi:hypothetical protein
MIDHPPTDPLNILLFQLHFVSTSQRKIVLTNISQILQENRKV